MIRQDEIALVIDSQRATFLKQDSGFHHDGKECFERSRTGVSDDKS